jgi:hypothetical protein
MITCVRIYNSGKFVLESQETESAVADWVAYNQAHRPGCGLFVAGKCHYPGYLAPARSHLIEQLMLESPEPDSWNFAMEQMEC